MSPRVKETEVFGYVLGRVVSSIRERRRWTQKQLAQKLGVSQPMISRIEAGKVQPDAYLYGRIANELGLTVDKLGGQVQLAMGRAKLAAEAATQRKPKDQSNTWDEALEVAGWVGLIGLIGFAVAAVLSGGKSGKAPG